MYTVFSPLKNLYFKSTIRTHPDTGKESGYCGLVESYHNADNRICHRTILNIGFMGDATLEQFNVNQKRLTEKCEHKQSLFESEDNDPIVKKYVEQLWQHILASKKLDIVPAEKLSRMINTQTIIRPPCNTFFSIAKYFSAVSFLNRKTAKFA